MNVYFHELTLKQRKHTYSNIQFHSQCYCCLSEFVGFECTHFYRITTPSKAIAKTDSLTFYTSTAVILISISIHC